MNESNPDYPLVSIGIPLYKAKPFLKWIVHNIETIEYPNLEFILSDQHSLDNSIDVLQNKFRGDERVRIFQSTKSFGWVDNFNFVIQQSRGKYIRVLSQDDIILPQSIREAVKCMEDNPNIAVINGPVDYADSDGKIIAKAKSGRSWLSSSSRFQSLLILASCTHYKANLGLVRRGLIVENNIKIPNTYLNTGVAVRIFLFAISFYGQFQYLPAYRNRRARHRATYGNRYFHEIAKNRLLILANMHSLCYQFWKKESRFFFERVMAFFALSFFIFMMLPLRILYQRRFDQQYRKVRAYEIRLSKLSFETESTFHSNRQS